MFERAQIGERALLVHIQFKDPRRNTDFCEFKELAVSAGALIVDSVCVKKERLDPKYLIGTGKLEEIHSLVVSNNIELILFNFSLSPSQERNLEKLLKCRVVDRVGLILDIFAKRARTFEGKLQVELAQLQHLMTRLVRGWTHLERQKGGIGLRGPGETQLESDRRIIRDKVKTLKSKLTKVRSQRDQGRSRRQKNDVLTVSLVGYTNAGKSSLFNLLTKENIFVENMLFATLDPTLRSISLPRVGNVVLADTVGFIRDLPHELIDSFAATLEETREANLLLHVIDVHDELWQEHKVQVESVLHSIGASNVPILEVYNKIDLMGHPAKIARNQAGKVTDVSVSAVTGEGLNLVKDAIVERLSADIMRGDLKLPDNYAKVRSLLYDYGAVEKESIDKLGKLVLTIALQQERWDKLCGKFDNLQSFLVNNI